MKNLLALYFSGTGNTSFAVQKMCDPFKAAGIKCDIQSIEQAANLEMAVQDADAVLIAHPIYGSCMPRIMSEFLTKNAELFRKKDIITLVTQTSFSGDGGMLAARLLKNQDIRHISSIHVDFPSNHAPKSDDENNKKIAQAQIKIKKCTGKILQGIPIKDGQGIFSWIGGSWGQRLVSVPYIKKLRKGLKIEESLCVRCGDCANNCPMQNIVLKGNEKPTTNDNCTACYRCINLCSQKAIRLMSKKPITVQYKGITIPKITL
ncbi:MAG: EFR1 family ferrodoxin [Fibromonadaceae bacterium]|jgi:Pyruvate/2-oxoacid:ferredoxin oxidoreductase delta subunit/flavodoxin|nr:EFR1 family ferrodoxin [Fibromonadaceae bacterium]